jgi:hypothetical protein
MNEKLIEYEPTPFHDLLLLQWHSYLTATGDIAKVLPIEDLCLSGFYYDMRTSRLVFKYAKESGIWYAAIIRHAMGGGQFDMWVHPNRRRGKDWLQAMEEAIAYGFEHYNVLLGLTPQKNLLDAHQRLGYILIGEIPHLWDGDRPVHVMYITKASFEARETHLVRRAANE